MAWLDECLADVPHSGPESGIQIGYKSSFLNTVLLLNIKNKSIVIKTDNLSVLAILKDCLSKSASSRKCQVNVEISEIEYLSV